MCNILGRIILFRSSFVFADLHIYIYWYIAYLHPTLQIEEIIWWLLGVLGSRLGQSRTSPGDTTNSAQISPNCGLMLGVAAVEGVTAPPTGSIAWQRRPRNHNTQVSLLMGWHQTFIIPCQLHGSRIIEHDGENMWVGDGECTAIMMN